MSDAERTIDDRRRAEEARARLAAIVDSSVDAIFAKSLDGIITSWNRGAEKMYGYTAEEVLGRPASILAPEDRQHEARSLIEDVLRGGSVEDFETVRVRKDGTRLHVSLRMSPILNAAGATSGIATIARDITGRVRSEAQLKKASAYARSLIEASLDPLVTISPEGRITDVNAATEAATGIGRGELIGRRFSDFFTEPDKAEAGYKSVLREGSVRDYPLTMRHVSGKTMDVLYHAAVIRDEAGAVQGVFAAARDITERNRVDEALRRSEADLKDAQRVAHIGNWNLDLVTGTLSWSDEIYRIFEIDPAKFGASYEAFLNVIHPGDRAFVDDAYRRSVESRVPYDIVHRLRMPDGRVKWVNERCETFYDAAGMPVRSVGTAQDVTDHRRLEESLREASRYARSLIEASLDPLVTISPDGKITDVNEATVQATGLGRADLLGSRFSEYFTEPEKAEAGYKLVLKHGAVRNYPLTLRHASGATMDVLYHATVYRDDAGAILGVFAAARDVTEQRRAEEARRGLEEQLRQAQKMEAVGQLAGGVAHDFNNILTVISGNVDLLLGETPASDPNRGLLDDVRAAAERAAGLTRQLLAFSRRQILEPRLVDPDAIVAGVEKMLRRLIGEDVELVTELAAGGCRVRVDPGQLEQVILNLAVNARDAMPHGGRLTVRTRTLGERASGPAGKPGSPRAVAISITDTGTGIAPEVKVRLFEPFFTTKPFGKGTGLGLATVYGIVTQSNGDVTVESEPGRGSTFTVILPAQDVPAVKIASGESKAAAPRGSETVLVVEDEDAVRRIVKMTLESAGYRVLEARSGAEALETAGRAGDIDLVVTDVVMPEMGGRELAERIAKDHPRMKILYMSGYTDDAVMRQGVVGSGGAFLQKPFSPSGLARKIREVLDGAAA